MSENGIAYARNIITYENASRPNDLANKLLGDEFFKIEINITPNRNVSRAIIYSAGRARLRNAVPAMPATFAFDGPEDAH